MEIMFQDLQVGMLFHLKHSPHVLLKVTSIPHENGSTVNAVLHNGSGWVFVRPTDIVILIEEQKEDLGEELTEENVMQYYKEWYGFHT